MAPAGMTRAGETDDPHVPLVSAAIRGRCPRCGRGRLFDGFLTMAKNCGACGLDFGFADTGDGPAVLIILVVGFAVVGGALLMEVFYQPPYWLQGLVWLPMTAILSLGLLRPAKALMLALQYRHKAEQGRRADD